MTQLFRIVYKRGDGSAEFEPHTGRKGTHFYMTRGAARSAVTQFRSQDRFYGGGTVEYKIQRATISEWEDTDSGDA